MPRRRKGYGRKEFAALQRIQSVALTSGRTYSRSNDELALEVLREYLAGMSHPPRWLRTCRLSTVAEDICGISLVIETDGLPLYLKIKNSEVRAKEFRDLRQSRWRQGHQLQIIGTVVANSHINRRRLARTLMGEVVRVREMVETQGSVDLPATTQRSRGL